MQPTPGYFALSAFDGTSGPLPFFSQSASAYATPLATLPGKYALSLPSSTGASGPWRFNLTVLAPLMDVAVTAQILLPNGTGWTVAVSTITPASFPLSCSSAVAELQSCHAAAGVSLANVTLSRAGTSACCTPASYVFAACGNDAELLATSWASVTSGFQPAVSSLLLTYMAACPRAVYEAASGGRATTPPCVARVTSLRSCALGKTFDQAVSACCALGRNLEFDCAGVDFSRDADGAPLVVWEPLRVGFTVPLVDGGRVQIRTNRSSSGVELTSRWLSRGSDASAPGSATVVGLTDFMLQTSPGLTAADVLVQLSTSFQKGGGAFLQVALTFLTVTRSDAMPDVERPVIFVDNGPGTAPSQSGLMDIINGPGIQDQVTRSVVYIMTGVDPMASSSGSSSPAAAPVCQAYDYSFCRAAVIKTTNCATFTASGIADPSPVCVDLAKSIVPSCRGITPSWRSLVGSSGNAGTVATVERLVELATQSTSPDCITTVPGLRVDSNGRVLSSQCPSANGLPCASAEAVFTVRGVQYFDLGLTVGQLQASARGKYMAVPFGECTRPSNPA